LGDVIISGMASNCKAGCCSDCNDEWLPATIGGRDGLLCY